MKPMGGVGEAICWLNASWMKKISKRIEIGCFICENEIDTMRQDTQNNNYRDDQPISIFRIALWFLQKKAGKCRPFFDILRGK